MKSIFNASPFILSRHEENKVVVRELLDEDIRLASGAGLFAPIEVDPGTVSDGHHVFKEDSDGAYDE